MESEINQGQKKSHFKILIFTIEIGPQIKNRKKKKKEPGIPEDGQMNYVLQASRNWGVPNYSLDSVYSIYEVSYQA